MPTLRATQRRHFFLCTFLSFFTFSFLNAQLPDGFVNAKVQEGYTTLMGIVFTANGQQMYAWDKAGRVYVSNWNGSTYIRQSAVVLDISAEVGNWRDFGLMSICLDPNFANNGLIYLVYMVDRHHLLNFGTPQYSATADEYYNASISRVTRYRLNLGATVTTDYTSRYVLLGESKSTGVPLIHESHAGGAMVFGRDGTLIISTGDNASFTSVDKGSASETYWQRAIADGIMRSSENVGAFRSQMLTSFCGKLLRIDPKTGNGLPSNPHYDAANPRSAKSRMWAMGLRNPFKMTIQPNTGSTNPADGNPGIVHLGDVGWNTWEDYHVIHKAGLNLGWPVYEGLTTTGGYYDASATTYDADQGNQSFRNLCTQMTSPAVDANIKNRRLKHYRPAIAWKHNANDARVPSFNGTTPTDLIIGEAGTSATGAGFGGTCASALIYYTGTAFGANYQNRVFFSDHASSWIRTASTHNDENHWIHDVGEFAPNNFANGIVSMAQCPIDESIFYVSINNSTINKISKGGNRPPTAAMSSSVASGISPLVVNFSSVGSSDPDGNPMTYLWDFGDGTTSTAANPSKTFTATGIRAFTVRLTVRDNQGLSDSKTLTISLNNTSPLVSITNPTNNSQYSITAATNYTLQANVTDNNMTGMQYAWQVTLRHNTHEHREPINTQQSPTVQISPVGCDGETYHYLIELTVTDNGGLKARDSVKIYPNCTAGTLAISNLAATPQAGATQLQWTNPTIAFDEVMVVAKANTSFTTQPNGTNYTADANFTGNGTGFETGKVVYRGIGTTTTITNLAGGIRYFFRVFTRKGTNWTGGVEASAVPITVAMNPNACYRFTARHTGKVMEVGGNSTVNGGVVQQWTWYGGKSQIWRIKDIGGGLNQIVNLNSGRSLDVWGVSIEPFTKIQQWDWLNNDNQKWRLTRNTEGYYVITAQHSGQALDVLDTGGSQDGTKIIQYPVHNGHNQQFQIAETTCPVETIPAPAIVPVFNPNACYRFTARHSGKVMEVGGNSIINGGVVQQRTWFGLKSQVWRIKDVGAGFYRLVNGNSGRVLDVNGTSNTDGATVHQWEWLNLNNQKWQLTRNTEGYYVVTAQHSGKALEVYNWATNDGAKMVQWSFLNQNNQQFQIAETTCPFGTRALQSQNIFTATGYREGKKAIINWVSNANQQVDYFVVQKFNTTISDFEKLETVNAKYTITDDQIFYSITDNTPLEGENQYRIALYRDGETTPQYSEIMTLDFNYPSDYALFPNPANEYVDIDVETVKNRKVDIQLTDVAGKVLQKHHIASASAVPFRMNLEGVQAGHYFISIQSEGKPEVTKKLIIAK